ncbi:MAG: TadE/TadG family type IV pilus assembly protein [Anaerolineae bacterium]
MDDSRTLHTQRRTGQTLAEFAITLPILLLLLFGIIEFGRIFQAWVTLQNSARAAARYATTGVYDTDKYQLDLNIYDSNDVTNPGWYGDLNSIVPCMKNEELNSPSAAENTARNARNLAQRGVPVTYTDVTFPSTHDIHAFQNGPESIYATYYSGDDCDPTDEEDQNRRKDLARLLSIWDEARLGAAGLGRFSGFAATANWCSRFYADMAFLTVRPPGRLPARILLPVLSPGIRSGIARCRAAPISGIFAIPMSRAGST